MGLNAFLVTVDGTFIQDPCYHRKAECYLAKCQRRVSKRKKRGHRRRKAVTLVAKAYQKVKRQRRDFHHKTALQLVRAYDTIYHEDVQVANLVRRAAPKRDGNGGYERNGATRKAGLNNSVQDAGWSSFLTILTFTAASAGKRVEAVNPAYTSQDCSNII